MKTAETRNVRQFHFTAWPDHGVPETTEVLINFRHLVREHMDSFSRNAPAVVHCRYDSHSSHLKWDASPKKISQCVEYEGFTNINEIKET